MIGANGRSVPEMALPESYNYIHKSGTLHEAPSPIIPLNWSKASGFAPIFPDTCYHLTHYWPAAADIPV
ncbi:hypothetical protein, partial [Escherichia coli]|uniref:hypothetical protein n=1 Tax=Escherichia coli TaxID=562 RepID=UPI002B4BAB63